MRAARLLILLCLGVGLAVVVLAARSDLRALRYSLRESEERALAAELKERARDRAAELDRRLDAQAPAAVYDADGALRRPAPPAAARPFRPAAGSPSAYWLRKGDLERAARVARPGPERAEVLIRQGDLAAALAEPGLAGTDLHYRLRLQAFRARGARPDADWIDDVSALLDGPSDAVGRVLLAEAGADPVGTRAERAHLAALRPRPGVFVDGAFLCRADQTADDRLALHRIPLPPEGEGPLAASLPAPYDALTLRAGVDPAALDAALADRTLDVLLPKALAALVLVVGAVYACVAIGRAARLASDKSDFVANVTHELKTPLANIRLYAESLKEGRVRDADRGEFLDTILEEGARLDALVEGLLHAARGPRLQRARLDPAALLREAEARWRPRLEREGFTLAVTAPDLPRVRGDREALLRALGNLLDNARKYGRDDPRVELAGENGAGEVRLTVRDHGPGIPPAARARVLQPFARLERADRKTTPGTGLGLSLAVSCMEAHGGRVEIGDRTVSLVLPAEAAR